MIRDGNNSVPLKCNPAGWHFDFQFFLFRISHCVRNFPTHSLARLSHFWETDRSRAVIPFLGNLPTYHAVIPFLGNLPTFRAVISFLKNWPAYRAVISFLLRNWPTFAFLLLVFLVLGRPFSVALLNSVSECVQELLSSWSRKNLREQISEVRLRVSPLAIRQVDGATASLHMC